MVFETETLIHVGLSQDKEIVHTTGDSFIRLQYSMVFLEQLKSDDALRKKLGGQAWECEIKELSVRIDKDNVLD